MKIRLASFLAAAFSAGIACAATDISWTAVPMDRSGEAVATNGTLAYAWCQGTAGTTNVVNGVPFAGMPDLRCADFGLSGEWLRDEGTAPSGLSPAYSNLLARGWWSSVDETTRQTNATLQLKNLTPGATYLVQFVLCSQKTDWTLAPGRTEIYAPGGSVYAKANGSTAGQSWTYGGSLVGTFTAQSETESFTFEYQRANAFFNALQVRKTVSGANPKIGSLSAAVFGWTATISLAGIELGTDGDGEPATSYSVSYRLNGGPEATVLRNQTGETNGFDVSGLSDGEYVCSVTIETDKGKTSNPVSVAFEIFATVGDFDRLKADIEGAADGATVVVPRGIYTATSTIGVTAKNLTVVSAGGKTKAILDGDSAFGLFDVTGTGFSVSGVTFKNGRSDKGGAIKFDGAETVRTAKISGCDFVDCTAKYGGAIFARDDVHADYGARSECGLVSGCSFLRCGTPWNGDQWNAGGAIYGSLWVENSVFDACYVDTVASRGQTSVAATSHMTVLNCVFRNQTLRSNGGGLAGTAFDLSNNDCPDGAVRLVGCTIAGNVIESSRVGLFYGRVRLDRCVVSNTTTTIATSGSTGGNLPSLYLSPDAAAAGISSTLFVDNKFPFKLGSVPSLVNCTFIRNVGGLAWFQNDSSVPAITNCLFWENLPKTDGWPWGRRYKGAPGLYWCEESVDGAPLLPTVIQIASTVVEGGSTNAVAEILALDPSGESARITADCDEKGVRFANPDKGDWSPRAKSPLTDAGVLFDWMAGARDLPGRRPRAFGGRPDVGCFEHHGEPPTVLVLR
ncbi:MAG: hypothetical protein IJL06_09670 [Kiritimatiellae bacterium]|nr:hypothetical protein [Kiritimatiellia bacterium]